MWSPGSACARFRRYVAVELLMRFLRELPVSLPRLRAAPPKLTSGAEMAQGILRAML